MKNKTLCDIALAVALDAHAGQIRDENGEQYINHPIRVAHILMHHFPKDDSLIAAAYCHDILEDCPNVAPEYLLSNIGEEAYGLVVECTNPSKMYPNLTRPEKKEMDRQHIAKLSYKAKCLKLADRTNNLDDTKDTKDIEWGKNYIKESMLLYTVLAGTHYKLEILYLDALLTAAKSLGN